MRFAARIIHGLRNLLHKQDVERDLDDEIGGYVDLLTDERVTEGMSQAEARRAALAQLGGAETAKQAVRDHCPHSSSHDDDRHSRRLWPGAPRFAHRSNGSLALRIAPRRSRYFSLSSTRIWCSS